MSRILDCSDETARRSAVRAATADLRRGRLVVMPTDTVYGVAADAFDAGAVAALLQAKGRGPQMPPPVLIPSLETVDGLATQVPAFARRLMKRWWPGPLTVVLRAQPSLRWDLGDTNGTVALRVPDDEVALALLRETGPLAVTSANRTGEPAATEAHEAARQLGGSVAVYLDAGPSRGGLASTIVDCTRESPEVLREGAVPAAEVHAEAAAAT